MQTSGGPWDEAGKPSDNLDQGEPSEFTLKTLDFDANTADELLAKKTRPLGPLGMRYLAEVEIFIKKAGTLEEIRGKLGLSQRKICQLLLVDPSAWTRWTKPDQQAPPHIYRSLQWFLALQDKFPEFKDSFYLAGVMSHNQRSTPETKTLENLRSQMVQQKNELHVLKRTTQKSWRIARESAIAALFLLAGLFLGKFLF